MTQADLDNWFTYHPPRAGQQQRYVAIRDAAKKFAAVGVANTPSSAYQTAAIRKIREAVMTANQGIACESETASELFVAGHGGAL